MALPPPQDQERSRQAVPPESLAPVTEFLVQHAPFDRMAPEHLAHFAKYATLGFYAQGEAILQPGDGAAAHFYVIKRGRVRGEDQGEGGESAFELVAGECFPIGALLAHREVRTVQRAVDDTFCLELPRTEFDRLRLLSPPFADFCARRLASLLDQATLAVQAQSAARVAENHTLATPIRHLIRRAPVSCPPDTPLREALARMHTDKIGSMVVVDADGWPLGLFTLHDLLSRVTLADVRLATPIAQVMTPAPSTLPSHALAYEAALLMAENGFGHLCVVDHGRLSGVISERDLFSLQRVGLSHLSRTIADAPDVKTLAALGGDVHRLIDQMFAQGLAVEPLTRIITTLNDHITRRVITLCRAEIAAPAFTWLSFGSEGRREQTLRTDQDNGMLFEVDADADARPIRRRLLPLAKRINEALAECGFPLCPGNIMAGNPECCLSQHEWRAQFADWIEHGAPEDLLRASIFFDLRPLYGEAAAAETLRDAVLGLAADTPRFRRQLVENALHNRPPLGLVRDFVVPSGGEHPNTLDLKMQGVAPFVDAARLLALSQRISATDTLTRLRESARAGAVPKDEAESWCDAYDFLQLLRMRHHRDQAERGEALDNHVNPDTLSELDRRILKEAFRQARKLQSRIALDYQL